MSAKPYGNGPAASKNEREARLVIVEEMLYSRLIATQRIERTLSKEFGVSERSIRTYIKTVRDRAKLRAQSNPDPRVTRELLTEVIIERMNSAIDLGDRARAANDLRSALSAEREALRAVERLADLHGLKVTRHELSGPGGAPLGISSDEAARQLAEALDRAERRGGTRPEAPQSAEPAADPDGE